MLEAMTEIDLCTALKLTLFNEHIKDQDAKIKALGEAIQDAIDANPTVLNLGNYHHDDVCKLQDEAIDVYYILSAALAAAKETNDE